MRIPSQSRTIREIPRHTIAVQLDLGNGFYRHIYQGLGEWIRTHPQWSPLLVDDGALRYFADKGLRLEGLIGPLGHMSETALARLVARQLVNISGAWPPAPDLCTVTNDNREMGRMAARFFIERGWRVLHFTARWPKHFTRERWAGIQEEAARAGANAVSLPPWEHRDDLVAQLRALPRPAAVIAAEDTVAHTILREARVLGIPVPTDLAILGMNDDELMAEVEVTGLSSVRPAAHAVSWKAAELIRTGQARPGRTVLIPPEGVTPRASTDMFAVPDDRVRRALALLQDGFRGPVSLDRIAREAGMGRRNMDLLFTRMLRVTPAQWLERLRLREAQRLLTGTHLTQDQVAERSGYGDPVKFWRAFRRGAGMAPGQYRSKFQKLRGL